MTSPTIDEHALAWFEDLRTVLRSHPDVGLRCFGLDPRQDPDLATPMLKRRILKDARGNKDATAVLSMPLDAFPRWTGERDLRSRTPTLRDVMVDRVTLELVERIGLDPAAWIAAGCLHDGELHLEKGSISPDLSERPDGTIVMRASIQFGDGVVTLDGDGWGDEPVVRIVDPEGDIEDEIIGTPLERVVPHPVFRGIGSRVTVVDRHKDDTILGYETGPLLRLGDVFAPPVQEDGA